MEEWLAQTLNRLGPALHWRGRGRQRSPRPDLWQIGTVSGTNPEPSVVAIADSELDRHLYAIGASGSGKSRFLELLVRQHIQRGAGFCLIDPHGDLTEQVVRYLYREGRIAAEAGKPLDLSRIHLIEPFRVGAIPGFNLLDPGGAPLHAHLSSVIGILRRLWSSSWGPRLEELLRTALATLAEADLTFVEVVPLLTDADFRARVVAQIRDDSLRAYWQNRFDTLTDAARAAMSDPVLNKVTALLADPNLRCMFGQRQGCLNFRRLMDGGAWVLINCSKGHLRDAAYLLGSMVVAHLQSAAMSRADVPESNRRPFSVLVDEFQNFRGDDFETILCEARKYRLRMVLAHQHLAQLDGALQSAIFGNVGTHVVFALSPQDASVVGREISDRGISPHTVMQLPVGHALVRRRGHPAAVVQILPVLNPGGEDAAVAEFAEHLRAQYGRPRDEVEAEIKARLVPPPTRRSRGAGTSAGKARSRATKAAQSTDPLPPEPDASGAPAPLEADDD